MIYIVEKGDTLGEISAKTGMSEEKIARDNQIEDRDRLAQGQALLLLRPEERGELTAGRRVG